MPRTTAGSRKDGFTPNFTVESVRKELGRRLDELLEQPWCQRLIDVDGAATRAVRRRNQKQIQKLQPASDLFKACTEYIRVRDAKISRIPRRLFLLIASFLVFMSALAVVTYYLLPSPILPLTLAIYTLTLLIATISSNIAGSRRLSVLANAEREKALANLDRRLRVILERSVRRSTRLDFFTPANDAVVIEGGDNLSSRTGRSGVISTRSRSSIELHLLRKGGAAVGVTGERGTGKSEIIKSFADDAASAPTVESGGTIGVFVAVPTAFDAIPFLNLVLRRLIEAIPGYRNAEQIKAHRLRIFGMLILLLAFPFLTVFAMLLMLFDSGSLLNFLGSGSTQEWKWTITHLRILLVAVAALALVVGIVSLRQSRRMRGSSATAASSLNSRTLKTARLRVASDAAKLMVRLKFAETVTSQSEGSLALGKSGTKKSRQRTLSVLPLTEADLVDEFGKLTHDLDSVAYRVIVGIDEMDKLGEGEATEKFLNTVKQLFAVHACSFIVSVSTSAWTRFVRRGVDVRDALDSSLDAIETIQPLSFLESRRLVRHRGEILSDSQILLCHALSGGLPRELLRSARRLARTNQAENGVQFLDAIASSLLKQEIDELIDGLLQTVYGWPPQPVNEEVVTILLEVRAGWNSGTCINNALTRAAQDETLNPDLNQARALLDRLSLVFMHLVLVRTLFCSRHIGRGSGGWSSNAPRCTEWLASIRREIELNPVSARSKMSSAQLFEWMVD